MSNTPSNERVATPYEEVNPDEANSMLARMVALGNAAVANANVGIEEIEATPMTDEERERFEGMRLDDEVRYGIGVTDAEVSAMKKKQHETANTCKNAATWIDEPDEPDDPLIEGLIEVGAMFAIVGPAKAAKSWLAEQLAVCVATGHDFFGRKVKRQRVYVANIEVSPKQYKKRLRSICKRMGVSRAELLDDWLFVDNLRGETATWEWCLEEAKMRGAQVVLIDPFYQIFQGKETDEGDCQKAVEEMKKFLKADFTLGVVFHAPKGKPGDREIVDMISGSSVLVRFPENVIAILPHATEKDARVVDCSILRDYPPPDPFAVKFDEGALVLASDITPELKSGKYATRHKSPSERDAETLERHNDAQKKIGVACLNFLEKRGDKLPGKSELFAELRKIGAKGEVELYMKSATESGLLSTERERVRDEKGGWKTKPSKQGGKTFISTPERIDAYRRSFNELPL